MGGQGRKGAGIGQNGVFQKSLLRQYAIILIFDVIHAESECRHK
ncbi:hypothetical protein PBAL39_00145 [Pedobacter sp. BAL39]|nr:hypothetical protein PBAL39_00145 [Pedobacter sp. BAL39]